MPIFDCIIYVFILIFKTVTALSPANLANIESVPAKIGGGASRSQVDEFDLLAQSRTDGDTTKKDKDDDMNRTEFDEMAAWLKNNVRRCRLFILHLFSMQFNIIRKYVNLYPLNRSSNILCRF